MIQSYQYRPRMSIPEALAAFLDGQGRPILHAAVIEVFPCGGNEKEGHDTRCQEWEAYLAHRCETTCAGMRRFRVEFPDGYGYEGYLALVDSDNWYICYAGLFYKVPMNKK